MSGEEDPKTLARVGVRRAPATVSHEADTPPPTSKILSVTRITLPAFEVLYRDANGAYDDGQRLRKHRAFELEREVDEEPGAEVVLEIGVADFPFSVTLLFRIVGRKPGRTALEWWARRQTDPKLLDLWLEAIESFRNYTSAPPDQTPDTSRAELLQSIIETYRRVLSSNPFDVLGLHWTSGGRLVGEAAGAIRSDLESKVVLARGDEQMLRYLNLSVERVNRAAEALSTVEGRRDVRSKMVPAKELGNARKQAEFLVQMAERDGKPDAIANARAMLQELAVP